MRAFLIIIIVIYLVWSLFRGPISRWFRGYMARRTEDMMRRMMGMPSRKEENRRRKEAEKRGGFSSGRKASAHGRRRPPQPHPAAMMKSVAVDVEYTEVVEFEQHITVETDGKKTKIITEEQISDAEYVEIKS